jgi:putative glutamine amidotransferase
MIYKTHEDCMNLPLVGLTIARTMSEYGYSMMTVVEAYVQAIVRAGALPLLIPLGMPPEYYDEITRRVDGVLFTGGGDAHPDLYGSQHHPLVDHVDPDRDRVEVHLLKAVIEKEMPFLGICRGLQIVNVALGGTLFEDILDQRPASLRHDWSSDMPRDYLAHMVQINLNSSIGQILGQTDVSVNSLHHQGIKALAPDLTATALAPDGLIEAFELPGYRFGLAVQWHPEWLPREAAMDGLFRAFVDAMSE